ncbi:sensor histidine kinase [Archangium lipolyticum]|uniref:sensor histidine kinase n=1 Tax=Archangium lipolyticum TaxID=2970465 RepID=UPI0021499AA3|nr:PAS domain S-box protein [Archangium lipolyticum]
MATQETPDETGPEYRASRLEAELQRTQAQLERRNRQLELLMLAARDLNSSLHDLDIMRRLVWTAMELVDATEGLWGRLIDGRMVMMESLWREGRAIEPRHVVFEPNVGVPGHVMVTGEPYVSNDAANDEHVLSQLQKTRGFYNLIDLPLFARSGELLGCFELHNKKDHQPFTQEDLELLKALRSLAGVALENARLFDTVQSERRTLETIVHQMPAGFILASAPSGRILYSNQESEHLLGHPEFLPKSQEQYSQWGAVHPDLTPYAPEEYPLARALRDGETLKDEEVLYRRSDGTLAHLSFTAAPIRDAQGRITEAVSVFTDISGRKRAERKLEESENKFRRIFESNLIGIVFGDIQGHLYDVNDYYASLIGVRREEVLAGKVRWDLITPPEDLEKDRAAAREMLESPEGVCTPYEKRYILPDGRVVWILLGCAFTDADRCKNVAFVIDITQNKESEDLLARSLASEQLAREEAETVLSQLRVERNLREQFVSALSHDLRTPLTAAKMSAQLIPRQPNLPDKVYSLAARVRHNIDRADQMITDLLDANRIRAGQGLPIEPAPCELWQVVADTLEELSTVHGDRFLLRGEERLQGDWDARALRRLVENLCGNAIKYGDPSRQVTVSLTQDGDLLELAVHNWGNPIPPGEQEQLFNYFTRTKSAETSGQKGWGIGLTLVRGVAEAHGGSVRVESTREKGTTFRVFLPRMAKSPG